MSSNTKALKEAAQLNVYAFPGTDAEMIAYSLGMPWPKGLTPASPNPKSPATPPVAPTVAPSPFDHHTTKEPNEPAVPLPNYPAEPLSGEDAEAVRKAYLTRWASVVGKRRDLTVSRIPKFDPGTHHRYRRFGEAYEVPIPEVSEPYFFKEKSRLCDKGPRESKVKVTIVSALGGTELHSKKPPSRARATIVSAVGRSVGLLDGMVHRCKSRAIVALKASGDGARRGTTTAKKSLRRPISSTHTRLANVDRRKTSRPAQRYTFRDRTGFTQRLVLHRGIDPGEVEHAIRGHDWTKHFDCALSLSQYSFITGTRITAALYFRDLPARLTLGVPWSRPSLTQRVGEEIYHEVTCECCAERPWVARTRWCERSPSPRFAAVITVGHLTRLDALNHDPFDLMKHARTNK